MEGFLPSDGTIPSPSADELSDKQTFGDQIRDSPDQFTLRHPGPIHQIRHGFAFADPLPDDEAPDTGPHESGVFLRCPGVLVGVPKNLPSDHLLSPSEEGGVLGHR